MTPNLLAERLERRSYLLAKGPAMGAAGVGAKVRWGIGKVWFGQVEFEGPIRPYEEGRKAGGYMHLAFTVKPRLGV